MAYERDDRIRRAAILVASLDEALAEQLLAEMPHGEAARILSEAERLDAIDIEEQLDVLAEFRRLRRSAGPNDSAVEFTLSEGEQARGADVAENRAASVLELDGGATSHGVDLNDGDAAAMAELLAAEHPQIVATALARLGEEQSAAVFASLPPDVQAEALERLGNLAPADEEAVQDIESQLQSRLQQRREHQARTAACADLVRKILARTPPAQRTYLLERIAAKDVAPKALHAAKPLTRRRAAPAPPSPTSGPIAQQADNLDSAMRHAQPPDAFDGEALEDRSQDLMALSDEALVAGLRASDESTVLRALAASGEAFLARVTGMLPRRQAKQLRRLLRDLAPTRLADMQQAQHELLRLAHAAMSLEAA
jgi:flagellar motor switch protein FliG